MITKPVSIFSFLHELREAKIHYELAQHRDEAVMVQVAVPGERWEIEILDDGSFEVEVFRSDGNIRDGSAIRELLERHAE